MVVIMMRVAAAMGLASTIICLTACDPAPPPSQHDEAALDISVGADGGALVQLRLGELSISRTDLLAAGGAIAPTIFPAASRRSVDVTSQDGGYPYAEVRISNVYEPGEHPQVTLDTHAAVATLAHMGYRITAVQVFAPDVTTTATWTIGTEDGPARSPWLWAAATSANAPAGVIDMTPRPFGDLERLVLSILTVLLLGMATVALGIRRNKTAIGAATASIFAAVGVTFLGLQNDSLGVAGSLSGTTLRIAQDAPFVSLLCAVASAAVLLAALVRREGSRQTARATDAPSWPPEPS